MEEGLSAFLGEGVTRGEAESVAPPGNGEGVVVPEAKAGVGVAVAENQGQGVGVPDHVPIPDALPLGESVGRVEGVLEGNGKGVPLPAFPEVGEAPLDLLWLPLPDTLPLPKAEGVGAEEVVTVGTAVVVGVGEGVTLTVPLGVLVGVRVGEGSVRAGHGRRAGEEGCEGGRGGL